MTLPHLKMLSAAFMFYEPYNPQFVNEIKQGMCVAIPEES